MSMQVDLDTVLEIADHLISKKDWAEFTNNERTFYYAYIFMLEVNNGGLHQFIFNDSGKDIHETAEALGVISKNVLLKVLRPAISFFLNNSIPVKTSDRRTALESININELRILDDYFYKYTDTFDTDLISYARQNMQDTVLSITMSSALLNADIEFKNKNYHAVIKLLEPYEEALSASKSVKLKLARKKNVSK